MEVVAGQPVGRHPRERAAVVPLRTRRRRLAARIRGPRAVAAHARQGADLRECAARRLGDGCRLHGGGLRLVRQRDRQLHATRHGHRTVRCSLSPRRCSSRNSSRSRWCATSPAAGTASALRALAGAAAWVATEWLVPRLLGDTLRLRPVSFAPAAAGGRCRRRAGPHLRAAAGERSAWRLLSRAGSKVSARSPCRWPSPRWCRCCSRATAWPRCRPSRRGPPPAASCGSDWCSRTSWTTNACAGRRAPARWCARCSTRTMRCPTTPSNGSTPTRCCGRKRCTPPPSAIPKSEAGAELDREILEIVNAAGVPFVFGTYDRDAAGEYNAAAFVAPGTGLLGFYRKTRPFPLTEYVPGWLDGADVAALAAVGRHLAAGHGRARVPAAPEGRPRDSGAPDDLPRRRRYRPGRRRCAAGCAGHPDPVERLLVPAARGANCTWRRRRSAASKRACPSSASPPTATAP